MENTKGSEQALVRVVWSSAHEKAVLSRNQGPSVPGDVDCRVAALNLIRVRDPLQRVSGECKFRGFEGLAEQRYHFVLRGYTQGAPQETKDVEFAQESVRYS